MGIIELVPDYIKWEYYLWYIYVTHVKKFTFRKYLKYDCFDHREFLAENARFELQTKFKFR